MSKPLSFTCYFPDHHPKRGKPTYFVEQLLNNLAGQNIDTSTVEKTFKLPLLTNYKNLAGNKAHTIRAGKDWSIGDSIHPYVWENMPHKSPLVPLFLKLTVRNVWDIYCDAMGKIQINKQPLDYHTSNLLARNDGLELKDLLDWFAPVIHAQQVFKGQVICWDSSILYSDI